MVIEADFYRVHLRFKRLFADPIIFEDPKHAVQRYLTSPHFPIDQTAISQMTDDVTPTDSSGKTPGVSGTARYLHKGRVVRSEFLENANLNLEYADFGSGLSPDDHQRSWKRQRWGRMDFVLEEY